jgi:hypothetical protein
MRLEIVRGKHHWGELFETSSVRAAFAADVQLWN